MGEIDIKILNHQLYYNHMNSFDYTYITTFTTFTDFIFTHFN